jgi:hypothetical protein
MLVVLTVVVLELSFCSSLLVGVVGFANADAENIAVAARGKKLFFS